MEGGVMEGENGEEDEAGDRWKNSARVRDGENARAMRIHVVIVNMHDGLSGWMRWEVGGGMGEAEAARREAASESSRRRARRRRRRRSAAAPPNGARARNGRSRSDDRNRFGDDGRERSCERDEVKRAGTR